MTNETIELAKDVKFNLELFLAVNAKSRENKLSKEMENWADDQLKEILELCDEVIGKK